MVQHRTHVLNVFVPCVTATLDQQVSAMSPAASAARKLVQSGLTLTQVYNQFAVTTEELEARSAECVHLRESMDTIIKQVLKSY